MGVHVEQPPSPLAITTVTLRCSERCQRVLAVATGGNPEYSFVWSDGLTSAEREVCDTAELQVTVTDTALRGIDFAYEPQTATAELTARREDCPTPDDGLCLQNGTFAAASSGVAENAGFHADGWRACALTPDVFTYADLRAVVGTGIARAPTDGDTYLGLFSDFDESAGQALCAPLVAGKTYNLKLDAYQANGAAAKLTLYGATSACGRDTVLWTSGTLSDQWTTYCVTFSVPKAFTQLMLEASLALGFPNGVGRVMVDNLQVVDACAP